jgi:hypothetical protein
MQAYSYDERTGEYIGTVNCQPSRLEPGVYLTPGHATRVPPPSREINQAVVWNGSGWEIKADYRGIRYWRKSDPAGGTLEITEIGVFPDAEWTDQDPAHTSLGPVKWVTDQWVVDTEAEQAAEQARVNLEARSYLLSTDWMVIRAMEGGKPVPQEVTDRRIAARAAVKE